jgi:hypothetical protein
MVLLWTRQKKEGINCDIPNKIEVLRKEYKDNEYVIQVYLPRSVLDIVEVIQFPNCLFISAPGLEPCEIPLFIQTDMGDKSFKSFYNEGVLTLKLTPDRDGKRRLPKSK